MHLHQAEIAAEFGLSRIPVRDALQALAAEGLVDLSPAGAMVSPMSVAVLDELYELRGLLEPRATALGVAALGRSDLRLMRDCDAEMRTTADPVTWLEANARFHRILYGKSGRPRLIQLVEQLRRQADRYLHLHLAVIGGAAHLHEEHGLILAAAEARDARGVEDLTRRHLQSTHDFILEYLADADRERTTMSEGAA
jgi:DNA-binding GntR family transcriptional regulator